MNTLDLEAYRRSPLWAFKPWEKKDGSSPQRDFIRAAANHAERLFRAGNRCGKTFVGAADTLLHVLGWHPFSRFRGPQKWWVSGLDWEFGIGQVIWPTMREMIPWDQVKTITYHRRSEPELPNTIIFRNGGQITFKSGDSGRRKYQGAKLHGIWLDEEHPADIIPEVRARLLDKRGYLTATLTPVMRARWVLDLERQPSTFTVTASLLDAAKAGLTDLKATLDYADSLPERQRLVRVEGTFIALEGSVYPEFSRDSHLAIVKDGKVMLGGRVLAPWPLPAGWPRFAAIDFGYSNPTAVVILARCAFTRRLFVERVYYAAWIRASQWAKALKGKLRLAAPLVADHDANERAELAAGGIPCALANKEVINGIESVQRMLAKNLPSPILTMTDGRSVFQEPAPSLVLINHKENDKELGRCDSERLAWELESYHYPPQEDDADHDLKDLPVKKDDHAADALRYVCMSVEAKGKALPPGYGRRDDAIDRPVSLSEYHEAEEKTLLELGEDA
jgi:phage terminase large subunit-like protein